MFHTTIMNSFIATILQFMYKLIKIFLFHHKFEGVNYETSQDL